MSFELDKDKVENLDACIKCSACTAVCPVVGVYPLFPGPKSIGPDAERFRLEGLEMNTTLLNYCSNCKTCEVTCPSGVNITELILRAQEKAKTEKKDKKTYKHRVRGLILGRAAYVGWLGTILPKLTNLLLRKPLVRALMEQILGISHKAPFPLYLPPLKKTSQIQGTKKQIVYFPGCFVKYNDALTGQAIVKVLEYNGYEVIIPSFHCCGVPLQTNGHFQEAKENSLKNLALLDPYLQADVPVITGCTSCGLALKEYLNPTKPENEQLGLHTFDLFEFLWELHERQELREDFWEVQVSLGYHSACHLKAQGIGTPAVRLLRLIPGVQVTDLDKGCCGLSGSYGYKEEKYDIAMQIGNPLFKRVQQGVADGEFQTIITECGSCQVQIRHGSEIRTEHPVWLLRQAYGLELIH